VSEDQVTAVKVIAHTADGRVYECAQAVNELYTPAAGIESACDDALGELAGVLRNRGLIA